MLSLLIDTIRRCSYYITQKRERPLYDGMCHILTIANPFSTDILTHQWQDRAPQLEPSGTCKAEHCGLAPSSVPHKHPSLNLYLRGSIGWALELDQPEIKSCLHPLPAM